ncbi:MAG: tetratricopeptide repeat protein [Candidatus Gastranaerophilales bacterium]|nr:tetratricopeptide repeat protein [Candidatus Gastranaerophilales bacterium]
MKKFLSVIFCLFLTCTVANADFAEFYNAGQQYLSQYQYSSAIIEFRKALRINYLDDSARIGLINSYMARGTYYANKDKNWENAANDFRAALFYLKYYTSDTQSSMQVIANATDNLNQCLNMQKFDTSPRSRFQKAQDLRFEGLFPEAGYEFAQSLADMSLRKESYEQIADIMRVLSNDPKCADYYKKAIDIDPNDADLRLKYARVLDKLGKNELAANEYNYALANGGNDPEVLYALERIYRQKLAQSPNDAATIGNLGAILQKQNKYDEALQYYTQAGQLEPTNVTTRLNLGTLYQQRKSYDAAIAAYDSILFLYPDNLQANFYKAQCLAAKGDRDNAIAGFKKVLSIDPNNKEAKNQIFDVMKESMNTAELMNYMSQNAGTNKSTVDDMYNYAIELHKQKRFDDAIICYKKILQLKSDNPEVYINLAIAYNQKQDLASAKQILQTAKAKFPNNKQIADNLQALEQQAVAGKFDEAAQYYNSGDYQKALTAYQSVQPPSFDSLIGTAACYKALNNTEQAIEYYKKALNLHPDSDTAYYIGALYAEKENWLSSKVFLRKALDINPNNTKAKDLYPSVTEQLNVKRVDEGIALYEKGDYPKATSIFNQVLTEDPKNAYAYYYKGLILDADKKYLPAIAEYKKAILYNPELTVIYYLMAIDYDSLAQYKSALSNYKKFAQLTTESNEYKTYAETRIKELKKYE